MKKSLLAVIVGAFTFASVADANIYAEGDIGLSQTKLKQTVVIIQELNLVYPWVIK